MERLRHLAEFWNWLPVFRAVAETSNLHEASRELRVSPSALSRTVRLLERALGKDLFDRRGRRLEINEAGEAFLARVRDAMRTVDEGAVEVARADTTRSLHVSAMGMLTDVVLPILDRFRTQYPRLVCRVFHHPASRVNQLLLQGRIDVAMLPDPVPHRRLAIEELGAVPNGIYCGRGHPLFRARRPALERVLEHPFAAPVPEEAGVAADNWPVTLPRRVEMELTQLRVAAEVCARGSLLVVLPDPFVRSHVPRGTLRRLRLEILPPTTYYAVRRETLPPPGLPEALTEAVRRRLAR